VSANRSGPVLKLDWRDEIFADGRFWRDYLWLEDRADRMNGKKPGGIWKLWSALRRNTPPPPPRYRRLKNAELEFRVLDGYSLVIAFEETLGHTALFLNHPCGRDEIGWDDQAHWHPHLFRWAELKAICRAIGSREPGLAHPGLPLLLLYRFAVVTDTGDEQAARASLTEAFWQIPSLSDEDVRNLVNFTLTVQAGMRWNRRPGYGWYLSGEDAYTLRHPDNPAFPSTEFHAMVEAAGLEPRH
jgi:hypothetical protein